MSFVADTRSTTALAGRLRSGSTQEWSRPRAAGDRRYVGTDEPRAAFTVEGGRPGPGAAGIAAHEAGHAIQDAEDYFLLEARTYIVPAVQLASQIAPWLFIGRLMATAVGTMPTFAWTGEEGVGTLGHLPSFVRVPYALPGAPAPWNIARAMDVVSVATLVLATLAWARRRRRGQAPESRS